LIVLIPLILVFVLASAIVCIYFWRRKMAKRQGKAFVKCIRI
jgi:cell division protein FtsL